jgi:hypothetical protein
MSHDALFCVNQQCAPSESAVPRSRKKADESVSSSLQKSSAIKGSSGIAAGEPHSQWIHPSTGNEKRQDFSVGSGETPEKSGIHFICCSFYYSSV